MPHPKPQNPRRALSVFYVTTSAALVLAVLVAVLSIGLVATVPFMRKGGIVMLCFATFSACSNFFALIGITDRHLALYETFGYWNVPMAIVSGTAFTCVVLGSALVAEDSNSVPALLMVCIGAPLYVMTTCATCIVMRRTGMMAAIIDGESEDSD